MESPQILPSLFVQYGLVECLVNGNLSKRVFLLGDFIALPSHSTVVKVNRQEMIDEYREARKVRGVIEGTLSDHSLSLRNFECIAGQCNF